MLLLHHGHVIELRSPRDRFRSALPGRMRRLRDGRTPRDKRSDAPRERVESVPRSGRPGLGFEKRPFARRHDRRSSVAGSSQPPGPGENASGLGVFRYATECGTVYGHTGNVFGYTQFVAASEDGSRSVTIRLPPFCRPARPARCSRSTLPPTSRPAPRAGCCEVGTNRRLAALSSILWKARRRRGFRIWRLASSWSECRTPLPPPLHHATTRDHPPMDLRGLQRGSRATHSTTHQSNAARRDAPGSTRRRS